MATTKFIGAYSPETLQSLGNLSTLVKILVRAKTEMTSLSWS